MVNLLYHFFCGLSRFDKNFKILKEGYFMFTKEMISEIDNNNIKAFSITELIIKALENGIDDFDVVSNLEIIRDYLKSNNTILDGQGV